MHPWYKSCISKWNCTTNHSQHIALLLCIKLHWWCNTKKRKSIYNWLAVTSVFSVYKSCIRVLSKWYQFTCSSFWFELVACWNLSSVFGFWVIDISSLVAYLIWTYCLLELKFCIWIWVSDISSLIAHFDLNLLLVGT